MMCFAWVNHKIVPVSVMGIGLGKPDLHHMITKLKKARTICIFWDLRFPGDTVQIFLIYHHRPSIDNTFYFNYNGIDIIQSKYILIMYRNDPVMWLID